MTLRWRDLARIDARIKENVRAARWLTYRGQDEVVDDPGEGDVFADALLRLSRSGAVDDGDMAAIFLSSDTPTERFEALWFTPDRHLARLSRGLSAPGAPSAAKNWGARVGLTTDATPALLLGLLDDESEVIASTAAVLLAETAPSRAALESVMSRFQRSPLLPRADAFLLAAVAMGATQALDEIRRRLAAGTVSEHLIQATAVAGGPREAELLASVAARGGPLANLAALVVGHLGVPPAAAALPDSLEPRVLEHVRSLVHGTDPAQSTGRRLIHGQPWTIRRALDRLADPDEWVVVRALGAAELAIRLGIPAGPIHDRRAPAFLQAKGIEALRSHCRRADAEAPREWFFEPRRLR